MVVGHLLGCPHHCAGRCCSDRRSVAEDFVVRRNPSSPHQCCGTGRHIEDGFSNHNRLPGVIIKSKEARPVDRPQAGMIFYNDEGTENGGLIFGERRNEKGEVVDSGGSLSFDKYGANEIVQLAGVDDSADRFAGLSVRDENRRIWVGRTEDGTASIALTDAKGEKRVVLQVTADGAPSLSVLGRQGSGCSGASREENRRRTQRVKRDRANTEEGRPGYGQVRGWRSKGAYGACVKSKLSQHVDYQQSGGIHLRP